MRYFSFIFLFHLAGIISVQAQDYPEVYRPEENGGFGMLPGHLVQFKINDADEVVFKLSFDKENWRRFTVEKSEPLTISLKRRTSAHFKLCTRGSDDCVIYKLKGAELYRVFWDREDEKWDLLRVDLD